MNDLSHSHKNKKIKSHLSKNSLFYVLLSEYLYVTIVLLIYIYILYISVYVKILNLMNLYEPHQLWCFYIEEPYIEKSSRAFQ